MTELRKIASVAWKELLLLIKDLPTLLIIFLMPVFLIFIITVFEENAFKQLEATGRPLLYVDLDASTLGATIEKGFAESNNFVIIKEIGGKPLTEEKAKELVAAGLYQVCLVIPPGSTRLAEEEARLVVTDSLRGTKSTHDNKTTVRLYWDPNIGFSFRTSVVNSIRSYILEAEVQFISDSFTGELPIEIKRRLSRLLGDTAKALPDLGLDNITIPVSRMDYIALEEKKANAQTPVNEQSFVQNNVPGYAMFAMFFIVIPISASLIGDKKRGIRHRLRTVPVSYAVQFTGRIIVYLAICLLQFAVMLVIGIFVFRLMNLPSLVMGHNYGAIFLSAVAASLAAIGFGVLTGTIARTEAQAAMFGAIMTVIFGAMGGMMVPVFLMPDSLRTISAVISPIRWGMDCFIDIFVRGGSFEVVLPNVARLLTLFFIALIVSTFHHMKQN